MSIPATRIFHKLKSILRTIHILQYFLTKSCKANIISLQISALQKLEAS